MTTTTIAKYYVKAVILPGIIPVVSMVLFAIYDELFGPKYVSEFLDKTGVNLASIILVAINSAFVVFISLPMFLNRNSKVLSNYLLSLVAWLLCPIIWFAYIMEKHIHYLINYSHKVDGESIFVILNTFPYIIGLLWTFINFRKEIQNTNISM